METLAHQEMPEFVRLLTQRQPDIYLYIRSLLADPHEAADVLQEVNLVLWEKREQFRIDSNFRAWAFQIARYKVLQHAAHRAKACVRFSDVLVDELAAEADRRQGELDSMASRLHDCLNALSAGDRDLIRKRYSPRATGESVAAELGRPVRWVYRAVSRIRKLLFDCVNRPLAERKRGAQ